MKCWLEKARVERPTRLHDNGRNTLIFPRECRESGQTYRAPFYVSLCSIDPDGNISRKEIRLGFVPILVYSKCCNLQGVSRKELLKKGEEYHENGGYFIVNGIERIIRLLILPRRHYVLALKRKSFLSRGTKFSAFAAVLRCVSEDERSITIRLHYLLDGRVVCALTLRRQECFIPIGIIIRALSDVNEFDIKANILASLDCTNSCLEFARGCLDTSFSEVSKMNIRTRTDALNFLGEKFRVILSTGLEESSVEIGTHFLEHFILIHLNSCNDKIFMISHMLQKLFSAVEGECSIDNPDSLAHQEILLPGTLLQMLIREKLEESMSSIRESFVKFLGSQVFSEANFDAITSYLHDNAKLAFNKSDIGRQIEYFLSTGNLVSKSGLDLSQTSGFTVVAEKLNYFRYISHYRSVHRGAYFTQLRTTTVRKLLPDSWGFLCPVHTPDGSPCGLLNHLSADCSVVCPKQRTNQEREILNILEEVVEIFLDAPSIPKGEPIFRVVFNGNILGFVRVAQSHQAVSVLRFNKINEKTRLDSYLEIVYIPKRERGVFPGLFLFSSASRLVRPVIQIPEKQIEYVGTLEQMFISISCADGLNGGSTSSSFSHKEKSPCSILSVIASLTPWSDYNQSPRNMYQCQMGKQTMGTPMHSICFRSDSKIYRLHTPQRPISITESYDTFLCDEYATGTNAIVAVLSHSGYDMEDAMIINRGSVDRGFAHATLYKSESVTIKSNEEIFSNSQERKTSHENHDGDGAPKVGKILCPNDKIISVKNRARGDSRFSRLKGDDSAVLDRIVVIDAENSLGKKVSKMVYTLRFNRNPVIGDKFSSRHGQKGVLSFLWPEEDMPYSERTGMRPDILINPHAFPSRMTIGMLVESTASKAGAMVGKFIDATPFQNKASTPVDIYEKILIENGFARCGSEVMVNSYSGKQFEVGIYLGIVYYQRLRHMVRIFFVLVSMLKFLFQISDKYQVRSLGPNNPLTHQPIKGRKAGGGIRFGEMERDSLLAHGVANLVTISSTEF